jgi:hypothetical protein
MSATAPTPSVPPPGTKAVKPSYRSLDFAYLCFACIAFALCFGPLLWVLPLSQGDREGYAMLLGVPIMLGAFIAGIVGLVLAIAYRSEWQLGAMAVAGVFFVLTLALDEDLMMIAAVFYTLMIVSFCGGWFFYRRRKMKRAEGTGVDAL